MSERDSIASIGKSAPKLAGSSIAWGKLAGRLAVLWLMVIVVEAVLLNPWNNAAADTYLWRVTRWVMGDQDSYQWAQAKAAHAREPDAPFYVRVDPPLTRYESAVGGETVAKARLYTKTESLWRVARVLGEPVGTLIIVLVVWIYDRRRWRGAVMLAAATMVAGIGGGLIRMATGRYRPINIEGMNNWVFWRGFHEGSDLSFPSGHATLAFATAAVLWHLSPRGRWLFLMIAAGTALSRVVMQAHFYSDVIFGAALGWTIGLVVARLLDSWSGGLAGKEPA